MHASIWHSTPGLTWQWYLSTPPDDFAGEAQVYDIDLFDNDASVIQPLHVRVRRVICYISIASWEDWHPDTK